ncbi:hypothetical protein BGW38_006387 [Lunasporangiospora selenospora]|uniref:PB1 domain-containing protein n=1 Tax=Lunasporangiospora selenospora TaxID=979761 RepID=A0A9P6FMM6_9FUNG|nr:hypothetical protein BGW38_006387 [Lunasporangiospora selenospora]
MLSILIFVILSAGLQRRATERVGVGRARRGTDPERPQLGHSASFSGLDSTTRRGPPGPSSLGQNGPDSGRGSPLSRRNTDAKRPAPLNLDETNSNRAGPASAAPAVPPVPIGAGANGGKAQYMDELDDIDRHVYALSIEAQEFTVNDRTNAMNYNGTPSNADLRVSPVPSRSNSNGNGARLHHPKPLGLSAPVPVMNGHMPTPAKSSYGSSPPTRMGTPPVMDLRRNGSANQSSGLRRDDSVRSAASGGSGGSNGFYQQPTGNGSGYVNGGAADASYLDEPVYSTLRDKIRVKCHYIDTRAVLVRADMPLQELVQRVQEKFQCTRTLKLKYKDEDQHMLSMIDDEDWLMAQDVHIRTMGGLDRIELWCFDEDD